MVVSFALFAPFGCIGSKLRKIFARILCKEVDIDRFKRSGWEIIGNDGEVFVKFGE